MNNLEVFTLIILGSFVCIANWRAGFLICVVAGFLQDPIRKIVPGEPVYLSASVGIFIAATCVGAYLRRVRLSFNPIHAWNRSLRLPMTLFAVLVIIQSIIAFAKTGSAVLALIGLLAYLSPLPAILLGYNYCKTEKDPIRYLKIYIAIALAMTAGIYLSYAGCNWHLLESVGEALVAYAPTGEQLALFPGFFRAPEVAAWHIGAAICLVGILLLVARRKALIWICAPVLAFFGMALLLTGRRKFMVEIAIFVCIYILMLTLFRRGALKSAAAIMAMMIAGFFIYAYVVPDDVASSIRPYYERGQNVEGEGLDRLSATTLESFQWVLAQNGVWGSGAGTGSQGAQYFGGGVDITGAAAEGGLAKVLAELGLPGLVIALWLAIGIGRYIWSVVVFLKQSSAVLARLGFGFAAFVVANAFVYLAAHQAFGDVFVLVNLGFMLGFVMAMPKVRAEGPILQRSGLADRIAYHGGPSPASRPAVAINARYVR